MDFNYRNSIVHVENVHVFGRFFSEASCRLCMNGVKLFHNSLF